MAYVKGFIEPCKMSVTISSLERKSTVLWKIYRLMLIIGCVLIMRQDLTRVNIAMAKRLCKLFLIANILLFRKILVALHKSLILVLTTSILLSVNSCLSDQILSFTSKASISSNSSNSSISPSSLAFDFLSRGP